MFVDVITYIFVAFLFVILLAVWSQRKIPREFGWAQSSTSPLQKISGSLLSVCADWIVGTIAMVVLFGGWQAIGLFGACLLGTALVMLPVWLVFLVPLYFLVPRASILWRPSICAPVGTIGGAALMALYGTISGLTRGAIGLPLIFIAGSWEASHVITVLRLPTRS
jgi:hypothetical protein